LEGISFDEALEAILANEAIYELAACIPAREPGSGGRPRMYPSFVYIVYLVLVSQGTSARKAAVALGTPRNWRWFQELVRVRFPNTAAMHLRDEPIRRHRWTYMKKHYAVSDVVLAAIKDTFEATAARQVDELELCQTDGPGSLSHPDPSRMLYGDGKVVTPLYKAKRGDSKVDKSTGGGEPAFGNKFVMMAVRGEGVHERLILTVDHVPDHGGEARVAVEAVERLSDVLPGAQGVIYDGAFRGVHNERVLERGLIPIGPVAAAAGGRTSGQPRVEKERPYGPAHVLRRDGTTRESVQVHLRQGQPGLVELNENAEPIFTELVRLSTKRRYRVKEKTYRWYNEYEVPASHGGGTLMLRLDATADDAARKFNRAENLRPFPPSDPDYQRLYPRRADAESINRFLDDTCWLGRAHSVGWRGQLLDLIGFGLLLNSVALWRHRRVHAPPAQVAA
jgi:hypothetical protein